MRINSTSSIRPWLALRRSIALLPEMLPWGSNRNSVKPEPIEFEASYGTPLQGEQSKKMIPEKKVREGNCGLGSA